MTTRSLFSIWYSFPTERTQDTNCSRSAETTWLGKCAFPATITKSSMWIWTWSRLVKASFVCLLSFIVKIDKVPIPYSFFRSGLAFWYCQEYAGRFGCWRGWRCLRWWRRRDYTVTNGHRSDFEEGNYKLIMWSYRIYYIHVRNSLMMLRLGSSMGRIPQEWSSNSR